MINSTDIQLLENYIDGLLSEKELKALETRLKKDAALKKELEQRKKIAALWQESNEYQKTKQQIGNILKTENKVTIGFFRNNYYLMGIAASFLLLFAVYWFLIRQHNNSSPDFNDQMAVAGDTLIMQQEAPRKYANIAYTIQLKAPVNNQTIDNNKPVVFHWKNSGTGQIMTLVIKDSASVKTVLRQTINSSDSLFTLKQGMLKPGNYKWFINDSLNREFFIISK